MSSTASRRSIATLCRSLAALSRNTPLKTSIHAPVYRRVQGKPSKTFPFRSFRALHSATRYLQEQVAVKEGETLFEKNDGLVTSFKELGSRKLVDRTIVDMLVDDMKLETMTDVQSQTINSCLQGKDVLAQARTGTGKTLGFLIPTAQRILEKNPGLRQYSRQNKQIDIRSIIISPTRELAEQIAKEARRLLNNTGLQVKTAVGGTQKRFHLQQMHEHGCHILVATPGRLNDLLSDPSSGVTTYNLDSLVLDEADRLLDDGFSPELYDIYSRLPDKSQRDRQTLMFSATMPKEVLGVVQDFMKRGYEFVRTVQEDEAPTHDRIPQKVVRLAGLQNIFPALLELIKRESSAAKETGKPFKAICFFNATAETKLFHEMYENLSPTGGSRLSTHPVQGVESVEMHSKLSQNERTRNSERFRRSSNAILFSSDVSARGMDFPGVTHVIQIGSPRDRMSYIHRIGRTGRAGKEGQGWIFVNPIDEHEARSELRGLPIQRDRTLQTSEVDMTTDSQLPAEVATTLTQAVQAAQRCTLTSKRDTFRALFGTHQWVRRKEDLVLAFNDLTKYGWGMARAPAMSSVFAAKMGLNRVRALNTDVEADEEQLMREERMKRRESRNSAASGRRQGFGGSGRSGGFGASGSRDRSSRGFGDRRGGFSYRDGGGGGRGEGRGEGRGGGRGGYATRRPLTERDPWA